MQTYFSTCPTGLQEIAANLFKQHIHDVTIEKSLDGLILYKTNCPMEKITGLPFVNNTFAVVKIFSSDTLQTMLTKSLEDSTITSSIKAVLSPRPITFRVIFSEENKLVSVDRKLQEGFEKKLASISFLKLNRSKPDIEFWFLKRSEEIGFLAIRLTKRPNYEKTLEKGELSPELCYLLLALSHPKKRAILLDPFAGSGAIPHQALLFPFENIFAFDNDKAIFQKLKKRFGKNKKIIIRLEDATKLTSLIPTSIDTIVTDPPWGIFENQDIKSLYKDMLISFNRILKPHGKVVLLTAQKELFENILQKQDIFTLEKTYHTLVSGKKAGVYILRTN